MPQRGRCPRAWRSMRAELTWVSVGCKCCVQDAPVMKQSAKADIMSNYIIQCAVI